MTVEPSTTAPAWAPPTDTAATTDEAHETAVLQALRAEMRVLRKRLRQRDALVRALETVILQLEAQIEEPAAA